MSAAKTTHHARGTQGYRSPELLNYDRPQYNNRSDIWALGCVLHELATGRQVFQHDHATTVYYSKDPLPRLPIRISYNNQFWRKQIFDFLHHFLSKEPHQRPNANLTSRRLEANCMLFEIPDMEMLTNYSWFIHWGCENMVKAGTSIVGLVFELDTWRLKHIPDRLKWYLVHQLLTAKLSYPTTLSKRQFWLNNAMELRDRGEKLVEQNEHTLAALIFEGLSQNAPESFHTSLIDAATDGDIFSIAMLLKNGEDPNKEDSRERTPLHWAAKNGHKKVVEMLLQHNPNVDKQDLGGSTALCLAAEYGHVRVVEILLQHKADVDKTDPTGMSALHLAAWNGHAEVVDIILEYNVDVDKRDGNESTALQYASRKGHARVVETLLRHNADVNNLKSSAIQMTALHWAAQNGHAEVLETILEYNADVDKRDQKEKTALQLAAQGGHAGVVKMLLQHNPNVDKPTRALTALHSAAWNGHSKVLEILLQYNPDLEKEYGFGETVLHKAVQSLEEKAVEILLQHNADVEHQDSRGQTALHHAVMYGADKIVVEMLLSYNADVNKRRVDGSTPLDLAEQGGRKAIAEMLRQYKTGTWAPAGKGANSVSE